MYIQKHNANGLLHPSDQVTIYNVSNMQEFTGMAIRVGEILLPNGEVNVYSRNGTRRLFTGNAERRADGLLHPSGNVSVYHINGIDIAFSGEARIDKNGELICST